MILSSLIAASEVAVDVGGLILGLLLGLVIYVVGEALSRRSGEGAIRVVAAVIAFIVFLLLGFDFNGDA